MIHGVPISGRNALSLGKEGKVPHIHSISDDKFVSDLEKLDLILSSKCLAMGTTRKAMDARKVSREELIVVIEGVLPCLVVDRYSDSWLSEDAQGQTVNVFSDEAQKRCTYGWVLKVAFDHIQKERHAASVHLCQQWAESVAVQLDYEIVKLTEGRRCLASGDYLDVERPYEHMRSLLSEIAELL